MRTIITSLKVLLIMTILTGVAYPLVITGTGQLFFPYKVNGSIIKKDGTMIGSELLGQQFDSAAYFWSRPSSNLYNPLPSGGSNLGPTSQELKILIEERKQKFMKDNVVSSGSVPSEMLFASGSGLDPHISVMAAELQIQRVAKARSFKEQQTESIRRLIGQLAEKPQYSLLGEERINVLLLNIELDSIK